MSKFKKIKKLINDMGLQLRKPTHWIALIIMGIRFIKKHRFNSYKILRDNYIFKPETNTSRENAQHINVQQPNVQQTHAQIWERIKPTDTELDKMRLAIPNIKNHYSFTFIIPNKNIDTFSSIEKQIYNKFNILIGGFEECTKATGDYIMFLQTGDFLHKNALFEIVIELNRINKIPSILYYDHDYFFDDTVHKPYYKPGWSPDLLLVNNYINRACVIRRELLNRINIINEPFYVALYDIMLKVTELDAGHHMPGILLTIPAVDNERSYDPQENSVRENALIRRGIKGIIERNKYGVASLKRELLGSPRISVIIPTCYAEFHIENCLKSIEQVTTYDNYEVIVVDNSRKDSSYGQRRLKHFNCKILYVNEPFNWSRLNNLGAKKATGDILIFLNDDTEAITPDWMERMAAESQRPEIGAVDVMLLYPDNRVYSAGVYFVNNRNHTWHSFAFEHESSTVYHNLLHYTRQSESFSGACFAIEKNKLNKVCGFDESFPFICNEMALYFKLKKQGYSTIYLAEVQLLHHHGVSINEMGEDKSNELAKESLVHLLEVWGDELQNRALSNPYLDSSKFNENDSPVVYRHLSTPINIPDKNSNKDISSESIKKIDLQISNLPFFHYKLVIGMYAGSKSAKKSWPIEKFAQLCDLMISKLNARIILFGDETKNVLSIVKNKCAIMSVSDLFSLTESYYTIKKVDYFVSLDSDFAQMAAFQGIPTLVIWHGEITSDECGAIGKAVMQIHCAVQCNPCGLGCGGCGECVNKIQPADVYEGVERLMTLYPREDHKM